MPPLIPYTLKKNAKAKYLRIVINRDATVSVVAPTRVSMKEIEQFIADKTLWIQKHVRAFQKKKEAVTPVLPVGFSRTDYHSCVARARKLVKDRLAHFNAIYQCHFARVSIKKQSTVWGSCSAKKNLNFNYKIVLLPPHLADYIIVHELCHLKEMNHGKQFWLLVAKTIPEHKQYRKELVAYERYFS